MISTPMLGTREKVSPCYLTNIVLLFPWHKEVHFGSESNQGGLCFHYALFSTISACVSLQTDSYAFVDYPANSYYLNPIDLTNLSSTGMSLDCSGTVMVGGHPLTMALESSSGMHHPLPVYNGAPPTQHPSATATIGCGAAGGSDLDINVIKDRLMTTRVPESCVWPLTNEAVHHRFCRFSKQSTWILMWAAATTYLFRLNSLYIHSTSLLFVLCEKVCTREPFSTASRVKSYRVF